MTEKEMIEKIALQVVTLENDDIPAMGALLNDFSTLEQRCANIQNDTFSKILAGLRAYLERMILFEETEIAPLSEGVSEMQHIFDSISKDKPYDKNIHELMTKLSGNRTNEKEIAATVILEPSQADIKSEISEEDIQILSDFVLESLENLEKIELGLIDLENDPDNKDTINDIFRPFHTIKGVSGFLNVTIQRDI